MAAFPAFGSGDVPNIIFRLALVALNVSQFPVVFFIITAKGYRNPVFKFPFFPDRDSTPADMANAATGQKQFSPFLGAYGFSCDRNTSARIAGIETTPTAMLRSIFLTGVTLRAWSRSFGAVMKRELFKLLSLLENPRPSGRGRC
jgi:hypothetical protein